MPKEPLYIGCASGFSGDRTDGAAPVVRSLIARGGGVLIFETLAERTLALAQLARNDNPAAGYEPLLDELVAPVLADCLRHQIRIVSNFGAANPAGAARRIAELAAAQGLPAPRIAVVVGDELSEPGQRTLLREQIGVAMDGMEVVSANAYLGAAEISAALQAGAQIVVAGRVADPSLTLGPAMAHFGWEADDWPALGRATMAGHMLECGTQVSGGYYCVPGLKDVEGLDRTGFPIAEISADGSFVIGKADDSGGRVDCRTVKEQLLYEVHDPARYLTPDVVADISAATVRQSSADRVEVRGITGHARPASLKVNVCYRGGWLAEAEISYAGVQAEARARLAADIVRRRIGAALDLRFDLIGAISILDDDGGALGRLLPDRRGRDIRLRVAGRHADRDVAQRVLREVTALYCCGPAGGGGVRTSLRPRLNMVSCTIDRDAVRAGWHWLGDAPARDVVGAAAGTGSLNAGTGRSGTPATANAEPEVPGSAVPDSGGPGPDVPSSELPGSEVPGSDHPGSDHPVSDVPGSEAQGSAATGPDAMASNAADLAVSHPAASASAATLPDTAHVEVPLYRLAHSRSGDKGDTSNLSLIAWDAECYAVIEAAVTAARVQEWFAYRQPREVRRYLLPPLQAMNLVLDGVLDGGVNDALNLDAHGKSLSFWLLDMPVAVPAALASRLPDV